MKRAIKSILWIIVFLFAFTVGLGMRHVTSELAKAELARDIFLARVSDVSSTSHAFNTSNTASNADISLLFAGDIMLSRGVDYFTRTVGNNDPRYPFLHIADTIQKADLAFANFENPISNRGKNQGSIYSFRARPEMMAGVTYAGFDVLSVANNHMWDYGRDALEDTLQLLKLNSITPIGAGMNYEDANDPKIVTVGGTRIAFLGYTNLMPSSLDATASKSGLSQFDPELVKQSITKAKKEADFVIISLHWGEEYKTSANTTQRMLAHEFIDAGANLVIGHHPHVVEEVENYKDGVIAYSLGNFIFDQQFSEETSNGLMLKVMLKGGKIDSFEKIPIHINETGQPEKINS